jgi:hypothetical protein
MDQNTLPAPFNTGDHLRYVGSDQKDQGGSDGKTEVVLSPGMVGVVILSSGVYPVQGTDSARPWHCQLQFPNGFQFDVTPENQCDFEAARGEKARSG